MLYQLYGLVISNEEPFQGLILSAKVKADLWIRYLSPQKSLPSPSQWFMNWYLPGGELWLSFAKMEGGYLLRFKELADFLLKDNGNEIFCMPVHKIPPRYNSAPYIGSSDPFSD